MRGMKRLPHKDAEDLALLLLKVLKTQKPGRIPEFMRIPIVVRWEMERIRDRERIYGASRVFPS